MDNRPVGIFDSGSGGLPAAGALRRRLPNENIIYLCDSARMPYGERSKDELTAIALRNIGFLKALNVKAVLAACGTVSANVPQLIKADSDTPVFGVLYPAVKAALAATKTGRIAVAATERAVASRAFEKALEEEKACLNVISAACREFAPMTENGHFSGEDPVVAETVRFYLEPVAGFGADTLMLGCTHYSLLTQAISAFLGPDVFIVDAGEAAAAEIAACLCRRDMLSERKEPGSEVFYYTGASTPVFERFVKMFFKRDTGADLRHTDLSGPGPGPFSR